MRSKALENHVFFKIRHSLGKGVLPPRGFRRLFFLRFLGYGKLVRIKE
jgi:hypothetical protein